MKMLKICFLLSAFAIAAQSASAGCYDINDPAGFLPGTGPNSAKAAVAEPNATPRPVASSAKAVPVKARRVVGAQQQKYKRTLAAN